MNRLRAGLSVLILGLTTSTQAMVGQPAVSRSNPQPSPDAQCLPATYLRLLNERQ